MTRLALADVVRLGHAVGFDAVGVTTAEPFPELAPRLQTYAALGRTGFEWADDRERIDPKSWLPQAKSLVAVAMAYLTPEGVRMAGEHPRRGLRGSVSVYAYGDDYHVVMQQRLQELARGIEHLAGRPLLARPAVDTSPLVDRRVAERAGIGWIGKNCMFFAPPFGSYVFLGTLCVDVEVEPAAAAEPASRCQGCSLCLDACPTGALLAPGVIHARACLSYVTQQKGIIPLRFRKAMGRRLWGCDTCQRVCPENRGVTPSAHPAYQPDGELAYPDLLAILHMTNRSFARTLGHTAVAWRGLRTWQRNALIALGNCGDAQAVPHMVPFLQSPREELRASAAWALRQIGGQAGRRAVSAALADETSAAVRSEMVWATADGAVEG